MIQLPLKVLRSAIRTYHRRFVIPGIIRRTQEEYPFATLEYQRELASMDVMVFISSHSAWKEYTGPNLGHTAAVLTLDILRSK